MEISDKITVLLELISCFRKVDYWKFDTESNLLQSNNESPEVFSRTLFKNSSAGKPSSLDMAMEYAADRN